MNRVTVRHLAALLCAALALAGCTSATNDQPSRPTTTTTTTTETSTSASVRPECVAVADQAQALLTAVARLATGQSTVDQVRAAAGELSDAFDDAKAALGPDARAQLDEAGQALRQVQDALAAQPVDTTALRTAAARLFAALGDAATVCSTGSPTSTGTTETQTETGTTTTSDTTAPTS
jgi:hypothetical protein